MKIRAVVVDDEPLARKNIEFLLAETSDVEVIGSHGNPRLALIAMVANPPELVFLDMKMPGMNGLELAARLMEELPKEVMPWIVFVTAFDEYALRAFDLYALDYLVKPFRESRFRQALERTRERIRSSKASDELESLKRFLTQKGQQLELLPAERRLTIREDGRTIVLAHEEITWVEAADHYLFIYLRSGGHHLVRQTLEGLESQLGNTVFMRVHRSCLVNLSHVRECRSIEGEMRAILSDGTQIKISRRKIKELKNRL